MIFPLGMIVLVLNSRVAEFNFLGGLLIDQRLLDIFISNLILARFIENAIKYSQLCGLPF